MKTINILMNEDDLKLQKFLQENLNTSFPSIPIHLELKETSNQDKLAKDLSIKIEQGTVDIFSIKPAFANDLILQGKIAAIQEEIKSKQLLAFTDGYKIPYVPFHVAEFYYNEPIFNKYQIAPIHTYEDFLSACQTLKENGITPFGASLVATWNFVMLLKLIQSSKNATLLEALKEIKTLIQKGYLSTEYLNLQPGSCFHDFYEEKLAMIYDLSFSHIGVELRSFEKANSFLLSEDLVVTNSNEYNHFYVSSKVESVPLCTKICEKLSQLYNEFCYAMGDFRGMYFPMDSVKIIANQPYKGSRDLTKRTNHVQKALYLDDHGFDYYVEGLRKIIEHPYDFDEQAICTLIEKKRKNVLRMQKETQEAYLNQTIYVNNQVSPTLSEKEDCKIIKHYKNVDLLVDYSRGIQMELPLHLTYDFSLDSTGAKGYCNDFYFRLTKEKVKYDTKDFIDQYVYKYYRNLNYLKSNNFETIENNVFYNSIGRVNYVCIKHQPQGPVIGLNYYVYVTITLSENEFLTYLFRTNDYDKYQKAIKNTIETTTLIQITCPIKDNVTFKQEIPTIWSEATKKYYQKLTNQQNVSWGCFHPFSHKNEYRLKNIEAKTGLPFSAFMTYVGVDYLDFNINEINQALDKHEDVVFTFHCCEGENCDTFGKNFCFEMLDGAWDDIFTKWAIKLKQIKRPFILRFSNEMNTDWTKYAGSLLMADPNNFILLYKRFYDICEKNGVDNAIFIMNGYDTDYPPLTWNQNIAYFPGTKYCHMMGLTGYNHGEYNQYEYWRDFNTIYNPLLEYYHSYLENYYYVLGEFGSTCYGGDKNKWIEDCFAFFNQHEDIKVAIWFDYADYDGRSERNCIASRPFWLDEKNEYIETFKKCYKHYYKS